MDVELVNIIKNQVINELKKEYFLVKKTNDFKPDTKLKNKMFVMYATEVVCDFYKISNLLVFSGSSDKESVNVRRIVSLLCREVCKRKIPFSQIGEHFGKEHCTVLYGYREVLKISEVDKKYKEDVDKISELVRNGFYKDENNNEQIS
jgi:chromosomal replication initiation ATPase DnaA